MASKPLVCLLLLAAFVSGVSAVSNAHCEGNTLVYYDVDNNLIKRDCSILHTGQGSVFRGICKLYTGGADCWRTEGAVTPAYRDAIRGIVNTSWPAAYEPVVSDIVTTTTLKTVVECPKCVVCEVCEDCRRYKDLIYTLNASNINNKNNAEAYRQIAASMVDRGVYDSLLEEKDRLSEQVVMDGAKCIRDVQNVSSMNNTYLAIAVISVVIMVFVVFVWVKYEFYGMKVDDPLVDSGPKRSGWLRRKS